MQISKNGEYSVVLCCCNTVLTTCPLCLQIRNIFGAQRHAPRSHYIRSSKSHNNGRPIDFIKPSACRMAGEAIQLMRILRIKPTLDECFASKVYLDLGSSFTPLKSMMKRDCYWDLHFAVCQLLYPLYALLRLADKRLGVYDKVKYLIRQVDRLLEPCLDNVVEKWKMTPVVTLSSLSGSNLPEPGERVARAKTTGEEEEEEEESGELAPFFEAVHLLTHNIMSLSFIYR